MRTLRDLWLLAGHRRADPAPIEAPSAELPRVDSTVLLGTAWHFRVAP